MPTIGNKSKHFFDVSFCDLALNSTVQKSSNEIGSKAIFTINLLNESKSNISGIKVKISTGILNNIQIIAPNGTTYDSINDIWEIPNINSLTPIYSLQFSGTIQNQGITNIQAEIIQIHSTDIDSTPANGIITEDDITNACISTPFTYADNQPIQIEVQAPAGYSKYQWYNNNEIIPNASFQNYTITDIGIFTYKIIDIPINPSCQAETCCPVIVERIPPKNTESIGIGAALSIVDSAKTTNGCWNITYMALIKNTGQTLLKNIKIVDSLQTYNGSPSRFRVVGQIINKNSQLNLNPNFDGINDTNLLRVDAINELGIGVQDTIFLTINLCSQNTDKSFKNQVVVFGMFNNKITQDISNDGGTIIAQLDTPTLITIPTSGNILIPGGFSPNGDGKNDTFIIGLKDNSQLESCEIYNRWGNLVFRDNESNPESITNGWDGKTNQGIAEKSVGVPDGTYFYAIKIKGESKTRIGFITIIR